MMQRKVKIGALALAVFAVGCAKSDYPLTAQERKLYMPVDRARIAKARDQKIPKIKAETYLAAAKLLEQQGYIAKAITQYRKAINGDNQLTEAYHRLGVRLSMIGQNAEATKMLRRAVVLSPGQPVLHNDLGFALTLQSQWAQAEHEFRRSIAIEPRFARAYINLGLTLSKMDRFDEAKAAFLAVLPEQDAYYNLGLMYRSLRRFTEASDAFRHVLKVDPEFGAATVQLEDIRKFVPTQPKSALPNPDENFAYQPNNRIETTQLVQFGWPNSTEPARLQSELGAFFDESSIVSAAPLEFQSPTTVDQSDFVFEPEKLETPVVANAPEPTPNNPPLSDIAKIVRATARRESFDDWAATEFNSTPNAAAKPLAVPTETGELVSYLNEDEFVLTPAELAMSPIGEIVDEVRRYCVADDWSAWTHLSTEDMASSNSDEVSVSPMASLAVMGYELRDVQSEINCLEEEIESRYAKDRAREAVAVAAELADATPDKTFDWLLVRSPAVSPQPLSELEMFMPLPPLDQDYVSLIAEQVGPAVDIGRIWSGESEVGSLPYSSRASAIPCDVDEARPLLSSSVFELPVLESFLPDSDRPMYWCPLPMPDRQALPSLNTGFTESARNDGDETFEWAEQFAVIDDGLSVLLNESRCRDEQWRLKELEPERLGYCRSDFVQACEPGITDVPPFLDIDEQANVTNHLLPWLNSSGERGP